MESCSAIKVLFFVVILNLPCPILAQIGNDTLWLKRLSPYEMELKHSWDMYLENGGHWSEIMQNKIYALDCRRVFIFEYLTWLGKIDLNTEIDSLYTVFAHGCKCGSTYLIKKGISNNVDINRHYYERKTALMLSMQSKNVDAVKLILSCSPDVDITDNNGEDAMILAIKYINDTLLIKLLLMEGTNLHKKNRHGYDALETAYYWGDDLTFNYLFQYYLEKVDSTYWYTSRLADMALMSGDTLLLKRMLPMSDPLISKDKNVTYLNIAVEFVEYYNYLNRYRDPSPDTTSRLYSTKDLDIGNFRVLLEHGYDINVLNSLKQNILFKCKETAPVAMFLIKNNIDVNQIDVFGKTALQYYVDEIVESPKYEFGITLKEPDRDYTQELNLLRFYIENGAIISKERKNGWHYIYEEAKQKKNFFLFQQLEKNYAEYIK